ncbi:hypothetical protein M9H77_37248 [Catharanthus roseus]|uniref:Uncharacterized protein n=1 Tax=Catharanthus roseus TaxID=4058 RepID=A0ACB9ZUG6_CATRO|nr:hypothetical protein M9H77_37248 [Catharanthus roseus]
MGGGFDSLRLEDEFESEFTLAEIVEMESLYKQMGEKSADQQFCEELATKFSSSVYRHGKSFIKWQQVHSWFHDTKKELEAKISSLHQRPAVLAIKSAPGSSSSLKLKTFKTPLPKKAQKPAAETPRRPIAERIAELSELAFEAKSAKDLAWYDVATFIHYRITSTAELEVRVRFAGFGKDQDEWINVRRGVRQRSIPLEPSECDKVKVGDLVLCFREDEHHAIYCDAFIEEIERTSHDNEVCKCIFVVRYDLDDFEDKVPPSRICIRPT